VQLDKTHIVIRERTLPDILDLALRVIRDCAGPLGLALLVGVAPMFLLNWWLLSGYVDSGFEFGVSTRYVIYSVFLVVLEIPLATAPATVYLGQVLFEERSSAGKITRSLGRAWTQLLFYQVFVRAILVVPVVTWLVLYLHRPYLNEVILLERNPIRQRSSEGPSTGRRCRMLHRGQDGVLFGRWMGSLVVGFLLFLSFWWSMGIAHRMLLSQWEMASVVWVFYFQLALWLVVGFFTVVRFLSYLDLRIRREGWEVELLMRAERTRLTPWNEI
jgi:hypothetical protein